LSIHFFQKNFDFLAGNDLGRIIKFAGFNHALALEAQFHDHIIAQLRNNSA
jgi:hypothetical protein